MNNVVYLLGAGASHACVKAVGSPYGILMKDLNPLLTDEISKLVADDAYRPLASLVNTAVNENTDFEHVITFLDGSSSALHRRFADQLRQIFQRVLRGRLAEIETRLGDPPTKLYEALLDMHFVPGLEETLQGVLSLNYDGYFEKAAERVTGGGVDLGIIIDGYRPAPNPVRYLKLHGSFNWRSAWPLELGNEELLWIPPGIQKAKDKYPFTVLWGLARELLNCDTLRVVGCMLGPNDWDLISLLFTTQHDHLKRGPYHIEIIDAPLHAKALQSSYPYLNIKSILEIDLIGEQLVAEYGSLAPTPFHKLDSSEQARLVEAAGSSHNWFRVWLKQKAESMYSRIGSVETPLNIFKGLLEEY
jgi:hypothetical protein